MKKYSGNLMLLLCAMIWGTAFVAQSVGMDYVGPFTFQSVRYLIGALVLVPVIALRSRVKRKNPEPWPAAGDRKTPLLRGGVLCGIALWAASCLQQVGIQYTTVGNAGFLTAMYIVIVPILGLFLGKRIEKKAVVCVALAVLGLYLISIKSGFSMSRGDAMMCLCALLFAVQILLVDHYAPQVDGVKLACIQFLVAGLMAAVPMVLAERPSPGAVADAALPILYTGVLSCGVAYTLQIIGQQRAEPVVATLLMSLESVFSMAGGIILLHQVPTLREACGCLLMLLVVVLLQLPVPARKKQ